MIIEKVWKYSHINIILEIIFFSKDAAPGLKIYVYLEVSKMNILITTINIKHREYKF